jgi:hypothetical protein
MLRMHEGGTSTMAVEVVELKEITRYEVPLSPPIYGMIGAEALASQDRDIGQPGEKPKG